MTRGNINNSIFIRVGGHTIVILFFILIFITFRPTGLLNNGEKGKLHKKGKRGKLHKRVHYILHTFHLLFQEYFNHTLILF